MVKSWIENPLFLAEPGIAYPISWFRKPFSLLDLDACEACHLKDIKLLKEEHQHKETQWEKKFDSLKQEVEKLEVVNKQQADQNYTLENQLKQLNISSASSSSSTLTVEEFKQLACRVNEQYHQCMTSLYTTLCEIQEL